MSRIRFRHKIAIVLPLFFGYIEMMHKIRAGQNVISALLATSTLIAICVGIIIAAGLWWFASWLKRPTGDDGITLETLKVLADKSPAARYCNYLIEQMSPGSSCVIRESEPLSTYCQYDDTELPSFEDVYQRLCKLHGSGKGNSDNRIKLMINGRAADLEWICKDTENGRSIFLKLHEVAMSNPFHSDEE